MGWGSGAEGEDHEGRGAGRDGQAVQDPGPGAYPDRNHSVYVSGGQ